MERIKDMLERIAGIYAAENTKTAIDIDLMLDYTRVLYAGLTEWKADLQVPVRSEKEADMDNETRSQSEKQESSSDKGGAADSGSNVVNEQQKVWEIQDKEEEADNAWEERMEEEDVAKGAVIANEFPVYTADETKPGQPNGLPKTPSHSLDESDPESSGSANDPKDEEVKTLSADPSGISFEPPHPAEPEPEFIKGALAEDAPEQMAPVREIAVEQQKQLPDYAQIFKSAQAANKVDDIRKLIGINDKYLFLNELFNNNKTGYEEALDQINKMDYAQAQKWVKETLAVDNKWFDDDETVKSFYDVLDKHFASR